MRYNAIESMGRLAFETRWVLAQEKKIYILTSRSVYHDIGVYTGFYGLVYIHAALPFLVSDEMKPLPFSRLVLKTCTYMQHYCKNIYIAYQ